MINESLQEKVTKQQELIIQPTDGPQSNYYSIKEDGGKIGRHSSNQILILEESISRYHAEIIFKDNQFFIKDIGNLFNLTKQEAPQELTSKLRTHFN
jgi:pSer/pThr/pTyr-binding forkhead associated (FHA) protein